MHSFDPVRPTADTITFRHIRKTVSPGSHKLDPRGGACIAYLVYEDTTSGPVPTPIIEMNWAKCHRDDVYDKVRAREIAKGRLIKNSKSRPNVSIAVIDMDGKITKKIINEAITEYFSRTASELEKNNWAAFDDHELARGVEIIEINKLIFRYFMVEQQH